MCETVEGNTGGKTKANILQCCAEPQGCPGAGTRPRPSPVDFHLNMAFASLFHQPLNI